MLTMMVDAPTSEGKHVNQILHLNVATETQKMQF